MNQLHQLRNYIFLALAFFGCATTNVTAQSFGVRVGLNATDAKIDVSEQEIDTDGETNLMLGIFANLPIGTNLISIQPELNYLNRGYSYDFGAAVAGQRIEYSRTLAYVDLGAILRLNFGTEDGLGFYVGAGPQYSYAVSGSLTETTVNDENERDVDFDSDRINRGELQFAAIAGLSYDLGVRVFIEGRYNGSFSDQSDNGLTGLITTGTADTDVRQRFLGLNAGVMVPLGR